MAYNAVLPAVVHKTAALKYLYKDSDTETGLPQEGEKQDGITFN